MYFRILSFVYIPCFRVLCLACFFALFVFCLHVNLEVLKNLIPWMLRVDWKGLSVEVFECIEILNFIQCNQKVYSLEEVQENKFQLWARVEIVFSDILKNIWNGRCFDNFFWLISSKCQSSNTGAIYEFWKKLSSVGEPFELCDLLRLPANNWNIELLSKTVI